MKHLYTLVIAALAPALLAAQNVQISNSGDNDAIRTVTLPHYNPSPQTNIISDWYNFGETIYNIGGNCSYFRNFLFPDSIARVEFSSGMGATWKNSMGQVFDPTSSFYAINQYAVDPLMTYTLDSIAIPYRYFRHQHGAPDTLVVQVYPHSAIYFQPNPNWSSGASYANVDYNYLTRLGVNASQTFTVLLDDNDTSVTSQSLLWFAVNMNMAAGQKAAVTLTYFPGNVFNPGDTIDQYMTVPPVNLRNAFVAYDFRDNDMNVDPLYYNNALMATTAVRYNISTNGWNGNYIPGTAYTGFYHCDVYFKITFDADQLGIAGNSSNSFFSMYPNPASERIFVRSGEDMVRAEIYDLPGNLLRAEQSSGIRSIDISHLAPGTYFIKVFSASGKQAVASFIRN